MKGLLTRPLAWSQGRRPAPLTQGGRGAYIRNPKTRIGGFKLRPSGGIVGATDSSAPTSSGTRMAKIAKKKTKKKHPPAGGPLSPGGPGPPPRRRPPGGKPARGSSAESGYTARH